MTEVLTANMPNDVQVEIRQFDHTAIRINYAGAHLSATHGRLWQPDAFHIEYIRVPDELSRQGIGKTLLRLALDVARQRGAERIMATVISRECLENMRTVYGEDSLEVEQEGEFRTQLPYVLNRPKTTRAKLDYPLTVEE